MVANCLACLVPGVLGERGLGELGPGDDTGEKFRRAFGGLET
jgi:hypothetical protein